MSATLRPAVVPGFGNQGRMQPGWWSRGAGRRWQGQISVLPRCALDLAQPGKMAREGQPGLECVLKVSVIVEETTHLMKCTTHSGECRKCISAA